MNGIKRIMTFNIRYKNEIDGENGWEYRKDKVVSMLDLYDADIAGLQEATIEMINYIDSNLRDCYSWLGVGRNDGKKEGEFCPVFYRKGKYEPVSHETYWLSSAMDCPGSKGWDAVCPRIVTCVLFKDLGTGRKFDFINTHFDYKNEANKNSAHLLKKIIKERDCGVPLVITGDFNCTNESYTYRYLTQSGQSERRLFDAQAISGRPHHGPSYTINMFNSEQKKEKIDFIFVSSNVKVVRHAVLADHWDGYYPSDHLPVLADISWPTI
ncbi:MAG: endonuclease/exonuclease/phosphatase family protein [Firmicutes bacterium]|nr:endonuclease/exonuclease/phosphatase family protein [Bacillota bacterium]